MYVATHKGSTRRTNALAKPGVCNTTLSVTACDDSTFSRGYMCSQPTHNDSNVVPM